MAHGQNAARKGNRKEWWGRRPFSGVTTGHSSTGQFKKLLHKKERAIAKRQFLEEGD